MSIWNYVHAFTAYEHPYPPYINVSAGAGGTFRIIVRSRVREDGRDGATAEIVLNECEFGALAAAISAHLKS